VLSDPPPGSVRLVPIGGLGEIGMNCLAIEQGRDIIVVDCGIRFPHDDLGVDVVHPDFTWLLERADRIRGIFLTHGHEDHIGGLPYFLSRVDVPVWGSPHTLGLVRHRLEDHDFGPDECDLRIAAPGEEYGLGRFGVEPIRVAHSIVEATALRIATDAGTIVHTGDFNFDEDPPDGEPTDEARLGALAKEGVALLLSDSTNVDVPSKSGSERGVGRAIDSIVAEATGRVFISLFASNIQRLLLIGDIALRSHRRVCVLGRSLVTQIDIATSVGRLKWPSNLRISPEDARTYPRDRLIVLAGGTQGEAGSAMSRLANGTHSDLAIEAGDTVIFSSRVIPGNDIAALDMTNEVLRRGARLHTRVTDPGVHTSGHATRTEQEKMLDLVGPRCFVPVHGTLHHLTRHGELARERGVSSVAVVENGTAFLCDGTSVRVEGTVTSGTVAVGMGGVELGVDVLRDRQELGRLGHASVAVTVDRSGAIVGPPSVVVRGIAGANEPAELRAVGATVVRALEVARRRRRSFEDLREEVRRAVRRHLLDVGGVKPAVDVHVLEV
jgi:ribonuclease J